MAIKNTTPRARLASMQDGALSGAVLVGIGLGVGQVMAYLLSLIAARSLGPEGYGVFGSMLALLMVGGVLALGIQAAGAKRIVLAADGVRLRVGSGIVRWSLTAALGIGVATVVVSPALSWLLHLGGPWLIILVAINLAPLTIWGSLLGVAQGREAFARLAAIYAVVGIGRAVGGIAIVVLTQSLIWTLVGMAVGTWVAVAACWILTKPLVDWPGEKLANFRIDVFHATHALLALFVLTNLDVLLARHFLTAEQAGLYAAGAVVTKVAFWLPQFVATIAYPRLTDHRRAATLTKGALAVVLIGIASVAFVALFPGFVVTFIGGAAYEDLVSEIWIFAAIGATFALAQFLLYSQIAASKRAAIVVLWIATAALVVLVIAFHASVLQIALIVLSVALSLSLVGVVELFFEKSREGRVAKHAS
jgi:O-antigen/teichoic acid export membrane protein